MRVLSRYLLPVRVKLERIPRSYGRGILETLGVCGAYSYRNLKTCENIPEQLVYCTVSIISERLTVRIEAVHRLHFPALLPVHLRALRGRCLLSS